MVDIVEVLSDPRFRALALGVGGGSSRGDVAGGQAAQSGQTSAAQNRSPEDQHGSTRVQKTKRNNRTAVVRSARFSIMTCECVAPLFVFTTAAQQGTDPEELNRLQVCLHLTGAA